MAVQPSIAVDQLLSTVWSGHERPPARMPC